jgi:hypothetical protein
LNIAIANLVHRLDDDEIDFLQSIRSEEKAREQDKQNKEKVELNAFRRQAIAHLISYHLS